MPDPILSSEKDKLELQVTAELLAFACTYYLVRIAGAEIGIEVIKDSVGKIMQLIAQQNQQAVQKALASLLEQKMELLSMEKRPAYITVTGPLTNVDYKLIAAVPVSAIRALKDSYDKKVQ